MNSRNTFLLISQNVSERIVQHNREHYIYSFIFDLCLIYKENSVRTNFYTVELKETIYFFIYLIITGENT